MVSFTELLSSANFLDGEMHLEIPEAWMQGRAIFGGLSASILHAACAPLAPPAVPLRSAQVTFIGPAGGAAKVVAKVIRQGRAVTFIEADLFSDKGIAARGLFVFGAARESFIAQDWLETPTLPDPDACDDLFPEGFGPAWINHFDLKQAYGDKLISGSSKNGYGVWARHRDRQAVGISALLAIADALPPSIMPMFTQLAPISTVTWLINFTNQAQSFDADWALVQSEGEFAGDGYVSQNMPIWSSSRTLLAAARQSVAIFA